MSLANQYANLLKTAYPGGAGFSSIGANTVDPRMAALSGAMQGFGFGGNMFGDLFGGRSLNSGVPAANMQRQFYRPGTV